MTNEFENTLRKLIISIIGDSDNSDYKVSVDRINKWNEKREIEKKKNKGILLEPRIIYYSDFYDLKTIIDKNWELFKPVLEDKKRFTVFFKEIEQFRNTLAHGRKLTTSQNDLLAGILMDLKNSITIFNNRSQMKDDYFIEITRVTDNLGNTWENFKHTGNGNPLLSVGDEYELIVEANDPKDRKIEYNLTALGKKFDITQDSNRFKFEVPTQLIGKHILMLITVSTPETDYENEDTQQFSIVVQPN